MAKKELAFEASVDIGNGAKSIRTLKEEYKAAQQELDGLTVGTKEYINQLQKLGTIKDEIGDLNEEIAAFDGGGKIKAFGNVITGLASGFQAAQGAMALFGAGGEDLQKTLVKLQAIMAFTEGIKGVEGLGQSFKSLGQGLKTNPILLIASIIAGIGTALFALKDKIKPVADAFEFLGDVIDTVVNATKDFLDYIGLTNFALDEQRDKIIANNEAAKKSIEGRYDAEIRAAKRAGEETEGREILKNHAIIELNNSTIRTLKAKGKERTEDEEKMLDDLLAANRRYVQENLDLADAAEDRRRERQAKELEDYKKALEEKRKADEAARIEALKLKEASRVAAEESRRIIMESDAEIAAAEQAARFAAMDAETEAYLANIEKRKQADAEKAELERQQTEANFSLAQTTAASLQSLSDVVFEIKMANLQKGSAAELKAAKQQFKINKALAITQATISTIQGVINALSAQVAFPEPYATIYRIASAAAVGIAGAANIAKISAQQFNAGGGGGGGGSVGAAGGGVNVAPPSTGSTLLNADGSIKKQQGAGQQTVKAIVTETDITSTQKRVNSIEETSKIK